MVEKHRNEYIILFLFLQLVSARLQASKGNICPGFQAICFWLDRIEPCIYYCVWVQIISCYYKIFVVFSNNRMQKIDGSHSENTTTILIHVGYPVYPKCDFDFRMCQNPGMGGGHLQKLADIVCLGNEPFFPQISHLMTPFFTAVHTQWPPFP